MNRITVFLLAAGACCAQPKDPCYVFEARGDITLVCQGKTTQITHRGDVQNFAVSDELGSLAYISGKEGTATVVDLKTRATKRVERADGAVSSCGGILPVLLGATPSTQEMVSGAELSFRPYARFRCSSDRKVVAGIAQHELFVGVPPSTKLAGSGDVDDLYFNVSPDGTKIAWFNSVRPLCVASPPGHAECIEHETMSDPVSVNNDGELLAAAGTGRGCDYKTSFNYAPAKAANGGDDECLGVGYWKPGMPRILFLQDIGRNPQWVTPQTAKLLLAWAAGK